MKSRKHIILFVIVLQLIICGNSFLSAQCNLLCNTDFEDNQVTTPGGIAIVDASLIPCWQTTANDNQIEVWNNGFNGVASYSGSQFLELNAYMVSTIFQNFTVAPGTALTIEFAHRGRDGVDVLSLDIGPVGGPYVTLGSYADDNTAWGYYSVSYTIPTNLGNLYSLRFNSVSSAGGNPAIGNFLDAVSVNLPYTLTLNTTQTNATCDLSNGTATATPSGGTAPYLYSWDTNPVQTTQTATGLPYGGYTVTVSDSNGCATTATVSITSTSNALNVNVNSGLNPLCDSTKLNWATWATVNATSGVGPISSNLSVTVTKPSGGLSTTGGMFNPSIFPPQYSVPVNSTAIRNDLAGLFTFCFNSPVVNPQIALSSIGNGNNSVQVNTSVPYQVIWQGVGMSYPNPNSFVGQEGYTIIKFPGIHTCISFDYLNSETYCNLAFGTLDTNCQALTPPILCAGMPDTLYASGAVTYSWTPAEGLNTTSGPVVIATPTVTTTYYVTGSDSNGCSDTDSITITVNPLPPITVTADTTICVGDSTILTASGADSYVWKPSNTVNPLLIVSPSADAIYKVVGTNSYGCSDSVSINVIVNSLPTIQLAVNEVCYNDSTVFTVSSTGNITSWNWKYGDATISAQQNTPHKYAVCDSFDVVLVATTLEGCVDSTTTLAKVNCLPIADFQFENNCVNDSIVFADISTVVSASISQWNWSFGDNSNASILQNVAHAYTHSGQFAVELITTTNKGCKDTLSQTATVHPRPLVQFNLQNVCAGNFVTFENLSEIPLPGVISNWQWNFGDNSALYTSINASHLYPQAGTYTVQLTAVSDFGCADSTVETLIVNPNPVVAFSSIDTANCFPFCASLQDESTIQSPSNIVAWVWHFGDNDSAITANAQHCFANTSATDVQAYTLSLTATSDSGCVTTLTKNNYIQVYPKPQAAFIADPLQAPVTNPVITFTNQSVGAAFAVWNFGETIDSLFTLAVPPYEYADTGIYTVSLVVRNQYGCSDTTNQNVVIEPEFTFYVPNAFSPDNDGVNDNFIGVGNFVTEYAMSIYDRWGVLLYFTDDINKPWNGTIDNGKIVAKQDTYVYSIDITDFKKRKYRYRGIVSLVGGSGN
jgi:gliding motility-associated-like protein